LIRRSGTENRPIITEISISEIREKPKMQKSLLKPIIIMYKTGAIPKRKKRIRRVVQCASKK